MTNGLNLDSKGVHMYVLYPSTIEDLLLIVTTQEVESINRITTIIELVVVWRVCSTYTCTVNQRFLWPQLFMQCFTLLPLRCCKEL